ncbi:MAG: hypothetical protein WBA07_26785 [Rivularia sp. (in: cyanobacteria)]
MARFNWSTKLALSVLSFLPFFMAASPDTAIKSMQEKEGNALHTLLAGNKAEARAVTIENFGNNGGTEFAPQIVNEIQLYTGNVVDSISINRKRHGGTGGHGSRGLVLEPGEYITWLKICSGNVIDYASFRTNLGRSISGGGKGGRCRTLSNVRVVAMGGKSGIRLDNIKVYYIPRYQPPRVLKRNVNAIVHLDSPGTTREIIRNETYRQLESLTIIESHAVGISSTTTASAELFGFMNASLKNKFSYNYSSVSQAFNEAESFLQKLNKTTQNIGSDRVGLTVVRGNLMESADGTRWIVPVGSPTYLNHRINQGHKLRGYFDLTNLAYRQFNNAPARSQNRGITYYR